MPHAYLAGHAPRAFAHRGWHIGDLQGCENSLAAFRRAVDEGMTYLETDVHLTADGVLVAFHDRVLDRVTDSSGPIASRTYRELAGVRIRGREPIPTMAELFEACPTARFNIDPKSDAAVGPLLDLLNQDHAWDRVCIGGFSSARVRSVRQAAGPRLASSLGPMEVLRAVATAAVGLPVTGPRGDAPGAIAAQVPVRYHGLPVITPRFLAAVHRAGMEVHAWTINTEGEMERLLDLGVDGIISDRPDLLRAVLQRRGQWS